MKFLQLEMLPYRNLHILVCIILLGVFYNEISVQGAEIGNLFNEEENSILLFEKILRGEKQKSAIKGIWCRSEKRNNNRPECEKLCAVNEICFTENGKDVCSCKENFAKLGTTCQKCNFPCPDGETCFFHMGLQYCLKDEDSALSVSCKKCDCGEGQCFIADREKVCQCHEGFDILNGKCVRCDCGEGKCSFTSNGRKRCTCKKGFLVNKEKCQQCDCGHKGTCSFKDNVKTCTCAGGYKDNNGICTSCPCKGGNCTFVDGVKVCTCEDGKKPKSNKCERCNCGKEERSCSYFKGNKVCECNPGFMQQDGECVRFPGHKANAKSEMKALAKTGPDNK